MNKTGVKQRKKGDTGTKKHKMPEPEVEEPTPLAMIPPAAAPHLPKEVLEGIGEGFLQIQPTVVSAALLEQDNLDD